MLIQFNFENYKSFKESNSLDLSALRIPEFREHIVEIEEESVLPCAVIFGANGSGKSNFLKALNHMKNVILTGSVSKSSQEMSSEFEVYFIDNQDGQEYNYGFSLDEEGQIKEEWLNIIVSELRERVFYRDGDNITSDSLSKKMIKRASRDLESNRLFLNSLREFGVSVCDDVLEFFTSIDYLGSFKTADYDWFLESESERENILEFLSAVDATLTDIHLKRGQLKFVHRYDDTEISISIDEESSGLVFLYLLYSRMSKVLNTGGLLLVDDLGQNLHPLVLRNILRAFNNPYTNYLHAQLIFTTHDTWILSKEFLRRDEIWFVEKDRKGYSSLYSLMDIKDSKNHGVDRREDYERNYLLGKYGAIPELKKWK